MNSRRQLLSLLALASSSNAIAGVVDWYNGVKVGSKLPAHEVNLISGTLQQDAKLTLIDFWATWCAPCTENVPHLNELHDKYKTRGLSVIGLTQEPIEVATPYLAKVPMRYPVGAGSHMALQTALGIKALPYALLASPASVILWRGQPAEIDAALIEVMLKGAA